MGLPVGVVRNRDSVEQKPFTTRNNNVKSIQKALSKNNKPVVLEINPDEDLIIKLDVVDKFFWFELPTERITVVIQSETNAAKRTQAESNLNDEKIKELNKIDMTE